MTPDLFPRQLCTRFGAIIVSVAFLAIPIFAEAKQPSAAGSGPSETDVVEGRMPDAARAKARKKPGKPKTPSDEPRVAMAPAKEAAGKAPAETGPDRRPAERTRRERDPKPSQSSAKAANRDGRGGKKISIEDDFLIEGKLEKPSAYYILRRSRAEYDWARLDAKFLPLVLESVQDPLF